MSLARRSACSSIVGAILAIGWGCGEPRPPAASYVLPSADEAFGGGSHGPSFDLRDPEPTPFVCPTLPDGSSCQCLDSPLYVNPPTIYFVLDHSGSMAADNKWSKVRSTVATIMRSVGVRAKFGMAMYPKSNANDTCTAGSEVMPIQLGDPPSSKNGPTTSSFLSLTTSRPSGGTPTSQTLEGVATSLGASSEPTFVILATDGAPNCNENAACTFSNCQLNQIDYPGCPKEGPFNCCEPPKGSLKNCTDAGATLAAVRRLKNEGKPVYVVGLPGTSEYGDLLDAMATEGGTALPSSPKYYSVDSASETAMLTTLKRVAARITATCSFELKEAPEDPAFVNVYLDSDVVPYEPTNGWSLDGKKIELLGTTCERVMQGDVLDVRIIAGCPRVEPS